MRLFNHIFLLSLLLLHAFCYREYAPFAGSRISSLLNASFGNVLEFIISILTLKADLINVVLASLTCSVLGNVLLVVGLSFFIGRLKYKQQKFNAYDARHNAGLLIFAVVVAFVFPEVFSYKLNDADSLTLRVWVPVIMIV